MNFVTLKCVKEKNKLRMKIITPGYVSYANCQFPKDIRVENQEYTVPSSDVMMADTRGKFFYRIKKNNIKIVTQNDYKDLVVFNEDLTECAVCLETYDEYVIFVPCGHMTTCRPCGTQLKQCCLCRANINQIITKEQLQ
jgi:hypothetical protein